MDEFEKKDLLAVEEKWVTPIMGQIVIKGGDKPVNTGFTYADKHDTPGAVLSGNALLELRQELADIDASQIPINGITR